jgi:O-antigen/teichoic acid export membrane protein
MLARTEFGKNVLKVLSGTTFSQALPLLVAPLLARLFTPEQFGVYYLFSSLVGILTVASTGRYELAVLVPKSNRVALHLMLVGGIVCTIISLLIVLILLFFNHSIAHLLGEPAVATWLWFIPLAVFVQGWYNTLNLWHNRQKRFTELTVSKVVLTTGSSGARVGLGLFWKSIGGLVIGTLIGWISGFVYHVYHFLKKDREWLKEWRPKLARLAAGRYRHFPQRMVLGSIFHKSSFELPAILLNSFFVASVAGFYGQMQAVIRRPLQMIGRAYEEVFKQKASEELLEFGHCRAIFYRTLTRLTAIGVIPFGLLFFLAPWAFKLVFGPDWISAGQYARYFAIPYFIQFIATPLSSIFYLTEHTGLYSIQEFIQLCLIVGSLIVGAFYFQDPGITVYLLAIAYGVGYLLRMILLFVLVEKK